MATTNRLFLICRIHRIVNSNIYTPMAFACNEAKEICGNILGTCKLRNGKKTKRNEKKRKEKKTKRKRGEK